MARINVAGRQPSRMLDMVHIIIGIVIVVMAVMAFIDPTENMVLFPLIFFAAAILKIVSGANTILNAKRATGHDRTRRRHPHRRTRRAVGRKCLVLI